MTHRWIDERPAPLDDAAVVRPEGAERSLVLTIDVITPIVDDPGLFGAIAATNALSDVYAMGGSPEVALSFVGFPDDDLPPEVLREILAGTREACARARCAIVGGHTVADSEPKCGLAVVGSVDPASIWSQAGAQAGDLLVLTKAIGTGLVGHAVKAGTAAPAELEAAAQSMLALNDVAMAVGRTVGAHACTDVTGFGLLGHLRNLVEASRLGARLRAADVPQLPGALAIAERDCVPGGTKRNLRYAAPVTTFSDTLPRTLRLLLADAQTSGGLLLCIPADRGAQALQQLHDQGCNAAAIVGELRASAEPTIEVA